MTEAKNTPVANDSQLKAILKNIAVAEHLGAQRAGLMALVESNIKEIDEARKEAKNSLIDLFKGWKDCGLSVSAANAICPKIPNGSAKDRKIVQRRRSFVIDALKKSYGEYDFEVTKGKQGGSILYHHVGCADTRRARQLIDTARELFNLAGKQVPKWMNEDEVKAAMRAQAKAEASAAAQVETVDIPTMKVEMEPVKALVAKVQDNILKQATN